MAIVTPIWRNSLTPQELQFMRITEAANEKSERWFVAPSTLDVRWYEEHFPRWQIRRFDPQWFTSVRAYSRWLTGPSLYEAFADYEFITICQTDAVLIRDVANLPMIDDAGQPIDYVGAPWEPSLRVLRLANRLYVASAHDEHRGPWFVRAFGRDLEVGNGGLTTRRTQALIDLTRDLSRSVSEETREHVLEDVVICALGPTRGLRIASRELAQQIYQETQVSTATTLPDIWGFHGLWRWNPMLAEQLAAR